MVCAHCLFFVSAKVWARYVVHADANQNSFHLLSASSIRVLHLDGDAKISMMTNVTLATRPSSSFNQEVILCYEIPRYSYGPQKAAQARILYGRVAMRIVEV